MPKIDDNLKEMLGEAPNIGLQAGLGIAQGMSPAKAAVGAVGSAITEKILGPTGVMLGMMVGVSRVLGNMVKQADLFGRGMSQMRSIEQMESKFQSILKSATLAKERMRELAAMSLRSPFKLDELANASRNLSVLTRNAWASQSALTSLADASAATGADIGDLSVAFGKLFNYLRSGRSIQNVAYQIMATGAVSGDLVDRLIEMQNAGAGFSQTWGAVTAELNRFQGAAKEEMSTLDGLTKRLEEMRDAAARAFGEGFVDAEKFAILTSMKKVEMVTPVLKEIGAAASWLSGSFSDLKNSIAGAFFDAIKDSGVLIGAWRTLASLTGGLAISTGLRVVGIGVSGAKKAAAAFRDDAKYRDYGAEAGEQLQRDAKASSLLGSRSFRAGQEALFAFDPVNAAKHYATGAARKVGGYFKGLKAAGSAARLGAQIAASSTSEAPIADEALAKIGKGAAAKAVGIAIIKDAFGLLSKAVGFATRSVVGFFASFGPVGWVLTTLGAIGTAWLLWRTRVDEAAKATEHLKSVIRESTSELEKQAAQIRTSADRAAALTKAYEELAKAKARLNNASRADRGLAFADVVAKEKMVETIARTPTSRSTDESNKQLKAEAHAYETYERPIAELENAMEGASTARQTELIEQIIAKRAENSKLGQAHATAEETYAQSDDGRRRAELEAEKQAINGANDPNDLLTNYTALAEGAKKRAAAIRAKKNAANGSVVNAQLESQASNADDSERAYIRLREEAKAKYAKPGALEEYKKTRTGEIDRDLGKLAKSPTMLYQQETDDLRELAKRHQNRSRELREKGDLSGAELAAGMAQKHITNADARDADLLARSAFAKDYTSKKDVQQADEDQKRLKASKRAQADEMIASAVEDAANKAKASGLSPEMVGAQAAVKAAEAKLRIAKEVDKLDAKAVADAAKEVDYAKQELAIREAMLKDEKTVANRKGNDLKRGNQTEADILDGNYDSAAFTISEEKKRGMENELFDLRRDTFERTGSVQQADEAVARRKTEMAEELKAQAYDTFYANDSSPMGNYRRKMREKLKGGMGADQARAEAEAETLAEAKASGIKFDAIDFAYGKSKSVIGPDTTGIEQFIGSVGAKKSALEIARTAKKDPVDMTTVLKSLDKKLAEAEAVLVVKAK